MKSIRRTPRRFGDFLRVVYLLAAATMLLSCHQLHAQVWETRSRMGDIRNAVQRFAETHQRLPLDLQEICPVGRHCELMPRQKNLEGLKDGWGHPFIYSLTDDEYELRSIGNDGKVNTADDLIFRPSHERARLREVAGCYRIDLRWWPEFPGTLLVLDSASMAPGAFRLKPVLDKFDYAFWELLRQDSILVRWGEIHSAAIMELQQVEDSLIGTIQVRRDRPKRIVASRVRCPDGVLP